MKKLLVSSALAVSLLSLHFAVTGCMHLPTGQTVINTNAVDDAAILIRGTLASGLGFAIQKDQGVPAYLRLVSAVLDKLLPGGDLTPNTVRNALQGLPVKELKTTWAQLAINTALMSYELFWKDHVKGKIGANYAAVTITKAIKDGIDDVAPPAPSSLKRRSEQALIAWN